MLTTMPAEQPEDCLHLFAQAPLLHSPSGRCRNSKAAEVAAAVQALGKRGSAWKYNIPTTISCCLAFL